MVAYNAAEVKEEVGRVFDELEEDLLAKLEELQGAKTRRELTKKERELHDKIIAELNLSEGYLKYRFGSRGSKEK